jgi:hypothetical protein
VAQWFRLLLAKRGSREQNPGSSTARKQRFYFQVKFFFQLLLSMILSFGLRIRSYRVVCGVV